MFTQEAQLAPLPEMVTYLAIFQRTFAATEEAAKRSDRAGIWLGGWLTYALHNVPDMLWHYEPDGWHDPDERWTSITNYDRFIARIGAPEYVVAEARRIVSASGAAEELGLKDDLSDIDPAPLPAWQWYLYKIYWACLTLRYPCQWNDRPHEVHFKQMVVESERTASVIRPIPAALVRWPQFDEAQFSLERQPWAGDLTPEERQDWRRFLKPDWNQHRLDESR